MVSPHFPYKNYNIWYIECKAKIKKRDERSSPYLKVGASVLNYFGEAKNAWIEFQHENGVCIDLALVGTEFKNDDLSILTYGDPYSEDYTECTVITKNDVLASIGEIESE